MTTKGTQIVLNKFYYEKQFFLILQQNCYTQKKENDKNNLVVPLWYDMEFIIITKILHMESYILQSWSTIHIFHIRHELNYAAKTV